MEYTDMILLPWISEDLLNQTALLDNPNAAALIEKYASAGGYRDEYTRVSFISRLSRNPKMFYMVESAIYLGDCHVDWADVCRNPAAVYILEEIIHKQPYLMKCINYPALCENPAALHLIRILSKLGVKFNCSIWGNPAAIDIIRREIESGTGCENWEALSKNPAAIGIIEDMVARKDKRCGHLDWGTISSNPSAVPLLKNIIAQGKSNQLHWFGISSNPAAADIILAELESPTCRVVQSEFYANVSPKIVGLFKDKFRKYPRCEIDTYNLFTNPAAVNVVFELIAEGVLDIRSIGGDFSSNPGIFEKNKEAQRILTVLKWQR